MGKEKELMKRQNILIIVFAVLLAAAAVSYFVFVRPIVIADNTEDETEPLETEEGETALGNRFYMFSRLTREDIASIRVDNEYGTFSFEETDGNFVISGHEKVNYNKEMLATLINVSANTLSKMKVGSMLSDEKLDEYGLLEPQASWTVTDKSKNTYRVLVGDRLLTGGGYYCMIEGRRSAYVLGTEVADTVLVPIEKYVTPVLCAGISQDDYYVCDNFAVYKDGEMMLRLQRVDKKDQVNPDALAESIMVYPTSYYPNSSLYYNLIYSYMNLTASSCYKLGADASDMAAVGLDAPAHRITFDYKSTTFDMCFSELKDGVYYACSNLYPDVIAVCSASDFDYLEYELIDWINQYIFHQYITNISNIKIVTDTVSADYDLHHSISDDDKEVLRVDANGKDMSEAQVANFRQYYKSMLSIAIGGYCKDDEYCDLSEEELQALAADKDKAYMKFEYTTLAGKTTELCFYRYSTRHSLMTVNGVGEFYVLTDLVRKIENDTVKVLAGETVTAHDKY